MKESLWATYQTTKPTRYSTSPLRLWRKASLQYLDEKNPKEPSDESFDEFLFLRREDSDDEMEAPAKNTTPLCTLLPLTIEEENPNESIDDNDDVETEDTS